MLKGPSLGAALGILLLGAGAAFAQDSGTAAILPPDPGSLVVPPVGAPCPTDACCPSGSDGAGCGGISAGVGLYIIQPYFENNPAFGRQSTSGTQPPANASTFITSGFTRFDQRADISSHVDVAPLVWLGYVGESGLGARVRWWYFREGTNQSASSSGNNSSSNMNGITLFSANPLGLQAVANGSQTLSVTSKLEAQLFDIEALQDFQAGCWDFLVSGGLRVARIDETYNAFVSQDNFSISTLLSGHDFQGVGPVFALEVRRPLGGWGVSLYGSGRASLLFGSAHQNAVLLGQSEMATDRHDRGLPIGELELGLEYGRTVGPARLFGQVALVGQDWFGAGSASRSTLPSIPGGNFQSNGYVGDSDISFFGVSFRIGMNF